MIQVYPMQEEDLEQVADIERKIFSLPWSKNAFYESMIRKDTIYLVAKEGQNVVGYSGIYGSFEDGEITNVAVEPAYRRQKVGKQLIEKLQEEAKKLGVTRFFLEVRESNKGAIELYKALGFKVEGIRKGFYEKPKEDALIMWKS
ncbi:ribosomal protein S18-alanine N-acetyltransferase [Anaerosacchariphilus polymeriproducens]|uniref:ribosomal protein S18-alanine N-acetyltransferase n=1 Tax=Anaerosacchariphilus polymeriproducens TaxID=1812858 RepID=UPI00187B6101|nr:ribosomal protein S18-alanine N-acetyltransferase [Anaerosacchariphilus polymeriproducens]